MTDYLKKYWLFCILTVLAMLGEVCIDLMLPDLMRLIIDDGVLRQSNELITRTGLIMLILVLCGVSCGVFASVCSQVVSQNTGDALRKDFFRKVMSLSFSQVDRLSTGSLITRISNDINMVQITIIVFLRAVVRSSLLFFGGLFMIYRESVLFGLIVSAVLPIVAVFLKVFLRRATPMFVEVQDKLDGVNNLVDESIAACRVVKAYVKEDYEIQRFDDANQALCRISLKVQKFLACISPFMNILFHLCTILILVAGAWMVRGDIDLKPGQMIASVTYVAIIMHGMMFMAHVFQFLTRAKVSIARVREVLGQPETLQDGNAEKTASTPGSVELSHVTFRYPGSTDKAVLQDISITALPGETVAIIGSTGSGKTSLVNLIPRFYEANTGTVKVDGVPVQDYPLTELRNKIAMVMQTSELYSRTIAENITMGKPDATDDDIHKAAQIAQAEDFIRNTTDQYNTQVTQKGHSLSGGQKQRLAIARAIIKQPEIIILDDATSALDTKTEAEFYKQLNLNYPNLTKIIIGQRISTVRHADRIIVLENGRIVGNGNHQKLLETSPVYRDINDSQMKNGEEQIHD